MGINQKTKKNGFLCQDATDALHVRSRNQIRKVFTAFGFTPLTDQVEGSVAVGEMVNPDRSFNENSVP